MNNSEQDKVNIEIINAKLDEQDYEELIHFLDKNNFNYWVSDETPPSQPLGIDVDEYFLCKKCNGMGTINEPGKPEKHDCSFCYGCGLNIEIIDLILKSHRINFPEHGRIQDDPLLRFDDMLAAIKDILIKAGYAASPKTRTGGLLKLDQPILDDDDVKGIIETKSSTSEEEKIWHEVKDMFFTNYANYNYPMQAINEIIKKYKISKR